MKDSPDRPTRFDSFNLWLAGRVWIPLSGLVFGVALLGIALLLVVGRVSSTETNVSELRYRSCIDDAVVEFKIAEGDAVFAAFNRDAAAVEASKGPYHDTLERLRAAQSDCRAKFPD